MIKLLCKGMVDTRIFYHAARGGSTPVMPALQGGGIFPVPRGRPPTRLPFEGRQDGWCRRRRQRASAGFFAALRSAQNNKVLQTLFCHPEERSDEGSRACALPHNRRTPPGWQHPSRRSEQSGRDRRALRAPTGWHLAPSCCFGKWVGSCFAGQRLYARSAS